MRQPPKTTWPQASISGKFCYAPSAYSANKRRVAKPKSINKDGIRTPTHSGIEPTAHEPCKALKHQTQRRPSTGNAPQSNNSFKDKMHCDKRDQPCQRVKPPAM